MLTLFFSFTCSSAQAISGHWGALPPRQTSRTTRPLKRIWFHFCPGSTKAAPNVNVLAEAASTSVAVWTRASKANLTRDGFFTPALWKEHLLMFPASDVLFFSWGTEKTVGGVLSCYTLYSYKALGISPRPCSTAALLLASPEEFYFCLQQDKL